MPATFAHAISSTNTAAPMSTGVAVWRRPQRPSESERAARRCRRTTAELGLERAHRPIHIRLRLLASTPGFSRRTGENSEPARVRVAKKVTEVARRQEFRAFIRRHAKVRRHDADHFAAPPTVNGASHDCRVGAESPAPESVEQQDHAARRRGVFAREPAS